MKGTFLAHVRRVSTSPEGRALVHAVNDAGLEVKIEVPVEAVRGVSEVGGHVLMLSWSLHPLPPVPQPEVPASPVTPEPAGEPMYGAPATAAPDRPAAASPSAVDQQFMALMSRGATTPAPTGPVTSPGEGPAARPEHQLAALLGIGIGRAPT